MGVKLNEKGELVNDDGSAVQLPDGIVVVKKDEHEAMTKVAQRLDAFDLKLNEMARPAAPVAPAAPQGPSIDEQCNAIDAKIETLDVQLETAEAAVIDGKKPEKSIASLTKERAKLERQRAKIEHDAQFGALANAGMDSIASLTQEVTRGQMPLLKVPEVKASYDKFFSGLPVAQRTSAQVLLSIYKLALGEHIDKVTEYTIAEANRKAAAEAGGGQQPGSGAPPRGSRTPSGGGSGDLPTFEEHFGSEQVAFIRTSFGRTPDEWAKKLGYKDAQDYVRADIEAQKGAAN